MTETEHAPTKTSKNPRATKEQLMDREDTVLAMLETEHLSAPDIAEKLGLSYPQTLLILSNLVEHNKIERMPGRQDRKILYTLCGPHQKVTVFMLKPLVDSNSTEIKVLKLGDDLFVSYNDLQLFAESTPYEYVYQGLCELVNETVN
jgi:hypothetical protein